MSVQPLLHVTEPLLVKGRARLTLRGQAPEQGTISLTARQLTFDGERGHRTEFPVSELSGPRLAGVVPSLRLEVHKVPARVDGEVVGRLYAHLAPIALGLEPATQSVLGEREVWLGPAHRAATLLLGRTAAVAIPERIWPWIGPAVLLPYPTIGRIRMPAEGRVRVTGPSGRIDVLVDDAVAVFAFFADRALTSLAVDETRAACLKAWEGSPGWSGHVVSAQPALQRLGADDLRPVLLVLTRHHVALLPAGGPRGGERLAVFGVADVSRPDGDDEPGVLRVTTPIGMLSLELAGGARHVSAFWRRHRVPSRVIRQPGLGSRALTRVTSHAPYLRLICDDGTVVDRRPGLAATHPDGVAIVVPAHAVGSLVPGSTVEVNVGHPEGIYQFDTPVQRCVPVRSSFAGGAHLDGHVVILSTPDEVRVYNRRAAYRVRIDEEVPVDVIATPPGAPVPVGLVVSSHMHDLSLGGCCITCPSGLPLGTQVRLDLPLREAPLIVHGIVVRTEVMGGPEHHLGLEFLDLEKSAEDRIQAEVMLLQREERARESKLAAAAVADL